MNHSNGPKDNLPTGPDDGAIRMAAEEYIALHDDEEATDVARHANSHIIAFACDNHPPSKYLKAKYPGWTREDFKKMINVVRELRNRLTGQNS